MGMGKRGAAAAELSSGAAAATKTRPAKKARQQEAPPQVRGGAAPTLEFIQIRDQHVTECEEICSLVDSSDAFGDSCRALLHSVAPHCLRGSPAQRHSYQDRMAEVLRSALLRVRVERDAEVIDAQCRTAELEAARRKVAEDLTAAEEAVAEKRKEEESAKATLQQLTVVTNTAGETLLAAQERLRLAKVEVCDAQKEKADFEEVYNQEWKPLRDGASPSMDEQERALKIKRVIQALTTAGCDDSLLAAMQPALKLDAADRKKFSTQTVEYAEERFLALIATLTEKVESASIAAGPEATVAAMAVLKAAEERLTASAVAFGDAQEATRAAERLRAEASAALDARRPDLDRVGGALKQKQERLHEAEGLLARFHALTAGLVSPSVQACSAAAAGVEPLAQEG